MTASQSMAAVVDQPLYLLLYGDQKKVYLERSEHDNKQVLCYLFITIDEANEYANFINSQTGSDRIQKVHKLWDIQYLVNWLEPTAADLKDGSLIKLVLVDKIKEVKARKRPVYKELLTLNKENMN